MMSEQIQVLFGSKESNLAALASQLNTTFSLSLVQHDSTYSGYYFLDETMKFAELRLYQNFDPLYQSGNDPPEDYWLEPDYREFETLFLLYGIAADVDAFCDSLIAEFPTFVLLKK